MKKQILSAVILLVFVAILISCGKNSSSAGAGYNNPPANPGLPANTIGMAGMAFGPVTLSVKVGTTVTWNNNDNTAHTVTADDNSFNSGNMAAGAKFSKTFSAAGTFSYHCNYHSVMKASIEVTQ